MTSHKVVCKKPRWQTYLESARDSAREIEVLTFRIANGGRDWSRGGPKTRASSITSPTETAALMGLTVVPELEAQREAHERVVGYALVAIEGVRQGLGKVEGDILDMFYIDGLLSWEIASELGLTVDGVFYRKRKALWWMDGHLRVPE